MSHRTTCLSVFLLFLVATTAAIKPLQAESPVYQTVKAEFSKPRAGLGNVIKKLNEGGPVKIAYLGGSITAAPGWRVKTNEWLAKEFPKAQIEEIHAAIGGTGSDLGVFRVQHDALKHRPDLMFVEFAVNDGGASPDRIWQAFDGIVRQTWQSNPQTDICFVYTFRTGYEEDLTAGNCPRAASAMEMLADHYGIPSINVALKVVQLQQAGKLIYKRDETAQPGVIVFSDDGVHPSDEGHQIYTDVIAASIAAMSGTSTPVDHQPQLATPFVADHWDAAKMVPIDASMLSSGWKPLPETDQLARNFGKRMGTIWEADEPGSKMTFKFKGSTVMLYDLLGPDGGQVIITVDGKTREKPVPRFDSYCTYHRIATLSIAGGLDPHQIHTASIEIHPEQPDRQPVAFRLKNPEEDLKAAPYQGTKIRIASIMVLGDIINDSQPNKAVSE